MNYSVKQLASIAGVTPRTLHFYDEIGLLSPNRLPDNGYRQYRESDLLRLQQIMFYRELGVTLDDIREILDSSDFDVVDALRQHRDALEGKSQKMQLLIQTIDKTIQHLQGEPDMKKDEMFQGFDPEIQAKYDKEARERWPEKYAESQGKWKSYSKERQAQIIAEQSEIPRLMAAYIGQDVSKPEVQALVKRWHQNIENFYATNTEVLVGLANMYNDDPRFKAFYDRFDERLAEYMREAIEFYCDQK